MIARSIVPLALALALVSGCAFPEAASPYSAQPGAGSAIAPPAGTGNVEIRVTDAPRHDSITEIWIGVSEVSIHQASENRTEEDGGNWISANITGPNPFELLRLKNGGIQEILGNVQMTAGKYTQIRLAVDNVTVKIGGIMKQATVPSGKIKFVHPFEVVAGQTTVLLFDFDAEKSVHVTGSERGIGNSKIMVKPVIKLSSSRPKTAAEESETPHAQSLRIVTLSLPDGAVNTSYDTMIQAAGGTAPYRWSLQTGSLPGGLTLNTANGQISGTPAVSGNFTFRVNVTDNSTSPGVASREYGVAISPQGSLIITTTSLPEAVKGALYSVALSAIGGAPPYSWSIVSGTIPPALALVHATGVISGTPSNSADYTFTVKVSDNSTPANTDTQQVTIRVKSN